MIALISIFAALIGNLVLYRIYNLRQLEFLSKDNRHMNTTKTGSYMFCKLSGFTLFGLIPGILIFVLFPQSLSQFGLSFGQINVYWYLLCLPVLIVGVNFFLANNPDTFKRYPEMRFSEWTNLRLAVLVIGWTIYLLGYEFLFRGLLLFSVYYSYGLFVSVSVNLIIYSLVHLPKGKAEMLGAIPFGILLCSLSLLTGSIILPFLLHLSLALSTDFFTIHYNPDMKYIKS